MFLQQQQVLESLGFITYESKPTTRLAYRIKPEDVYFIKAVDDSTAMLKINGIEVSFKHHQEIESGSFIVFLKEDDIYHCSFDVFNDRNIFPCAK